MHDVKKNDLKIRFLFSFSGETPIFIAIKRNCFDIAELLIAKGVDLEVKNKNGNNPFVWKNDLIDDVKFKLFYLAHLFGGSLGKKRIFRQPSS